MVGMMTELAPQTFETPPADVRLTRMMRQLLVYIVAHPGSTTLEIALATDHRPVYAAAALAALHQYRWIATDEHHSRWCHDCRWVARPEAAQFIKKGTVVDRG